MLPYDINQLTKYTVDAYYLQCARENELPLLSLDENMLKIAKAMKISVME
jgi:predicted nucleic acid-binding protein